MIELTHQPIDALRVLQRVQSNQAGACLLFLGTTREFTGPRQTESLDYECYPEMAEKKLAELEQQARQEWPLIGVCMIHRLGHLEIGEASIAIAVSSPHRRDAFEAGRWLIDTVKQVVPIWKQENWSDGTRQWVHPGVETPLTSSAPAITSSAPAITSSAPAITSSAPAITSSAPAITSSAPAENSSAPAESNPAPAENNPEPRERTWSDEGQNHR